MFVRFWYGYYVCGMKFLFSGMFHMLVRYVSPKGHMYFKYMMFILTGSVELLVCLFIASWM